MNQDTPSQGSVFAPPPATSGIEPKPDERSMAMLAHLLGIFTQFLGPLIIWLVKKDTSPFVDDQGKEALNWQITFIIGYIVSGMLTFVVIGCFLMPALFVCNIVFCILGAVAANKGERYRYPFALRLIR
jgi:uncharacterized protein